MPSPFPGMDPYLESPAQWPDFHARFINALADQLNDLLPEEFVARINEHVMAIAPTMRDEGDDPEFVPDVTLLGSSEVLPVSGGATSLSPADQGGGLLMPTRVRNIKFSDEYSESYLEVHRLPDMQVVTLIELLSPTNKYGEGRGTYMRKRRELLSQPVNLVELDLIRAGGRIEFSEPLPSAHYHAFVSSKEHRPMTEVYSWSVRDPLPNIPIPLLSPGDAVQIDLAKPFSRSYDAGRYRRIIRYSAAPPAPSFSSSDSQWVRQIADTIVR